MIHRIFSDLPRFKAMRFHEGLNLVLADKSPNATDRQTRNGAGKTSLIELIHFLTGGNCDPNSIFRTQDLLEHKFGMELDLGGRRVVVERSGRAPSKLTVSGETDRWPALPKRDHSTGDTVISNENWKVVLARLMFNLADDGEGDDHKFGPTFRSLFAYFVRRQSAGGFALPTQQSSKQQPWDQQVALSFLLGLDWTIPQAWQVVREREKALETLRKAASQGALGELIGTAAELRTQLTVAEERCRQLRERVARFRVLPEYQNYEREASELTRNLNELANENALDRQLLAELQRAVHVEAPPPMADLEHLYQGVGVALPDVAVRRFDEVRQFHESVVVNRRSYLAEEIEDARRRIAQREQQKEQKDARRAEVMNVLRTHGALEHYSLLQADLNRVEGQAEVLRQRFKMAEQLESGKTELEIERGKLLTRLRRDYHEQEGRLKAAILAFEEVSNSLYEQPGNLEISAEPNGPKFEVKIHASKSKGISNMQIFCFDLMLTRLCADRGIGPGFLVHDSHLFDGVDERQVAKALEIGAETTGRLGWQYIVTLNSDALPAPFENHPGVVRPKLTDATEDGGLFGLRFG